MPILCDVLEKVVIQRVTNDQLVVLQRVSRETFIEAFAGDNTAEDMQYYLENNLGLPQLTGEINHPGSQFYFAETASGIAGYLKVNTGAAQHELQDRHTLEIERIYIYKKYYGSGAGLVLLNHAIQLAEQMQAEFIWLAVWEKNFRAFRFYEKHGFTPFGTHDFILGSDVQKDILMKREL